MLLKALIEQTLETEETRFLQTLDRGLKLLDEELTSLPEDAELPGAAAFKLYDTYGFPLDLTQDALREKGRSVDVSGFDAAMEARIKSEDMSALKFSEKVAAAVRFRIEAATDKEAVRRGTTLFALPVYAADGAKLIWGTCDAIWTALGDASEDVNWYTKRATLSGVYGSTVLFWLGDTSDNHQATWDFLDRRIDNVMQFEKVKAQINANPLASKLLIGPNWLMSKIRKPMTMPDADLPGYFRGDTK